MVKRLVESPAIEGLAREHLKGIVYGGGPMYVADCKAAFAALGPRLAQIYGQGESPMTITAMDRAAVADAIARDDLHRIGSVGTAQLGIERPHRRRRTMCRCRRARSARCWCAGPR